MRLPFVRLAVAAAGVFVILSCDTPPAGPKFGNGISGGPTGTSPVTPPNPAIPDTNDPDVLLDIPAVVDQEFNVGDSLLVQTHILDDRGLRSVIMSGLKFTGNADLGTLVETIRYGEARAPVGGASFRANLTDTTIRRYLHPVIPVDTSIDSLIIRVIVTDAAGNIDSVKRRVKVVTGPKVTIESPLPNDFVSQGIPMSVRVHVTHPDGVRSLTVIAQGEPTWPAADRITSPPTVTYVGQQKDITQTFTIPISATAPVGGKITINASAIAVNGNPGSTAPVVVVVRAAGVAIPQVLQTVPGRLEITDSVRVTASGDGITTVGILVYDAGTGVLITDNRVTLTTISSNPSQNVPLNLAPSDRGRSVTIASYAIDQAGVTGYSVRSAASGTQITASLAFTDPSLIVFGQTYQLPRAGVVGDIIVDDSRGHVFLSNLSNNRLELWQAATGRFYDPGIAVGAAPWGLARAIYLGARSDTILVANSGGTNITKVEIGFDDPTLIKEVLSARVRTRTSPLFEVIELVSNNRVTITVSEPILFSNRPQYIGQITNGFIYFSTRPTTEALKGIVHWYDPSQLFPDLHTITNFKAAPTTPNYLITDADSVFIRPATAGTGESDTLFVWDHTPGTTNASVAAVMPSLATPTVGVGAAVKRLQLLVGSDIQAIPRVDVASIGLTDTTFVAVSGDYNWVGFGGGNTAGAGNIFMSSPGFFSPIFSQKDLTNNAAERIFGLALDANGSTIAAHGTESYFSSVDVPFHLRLQGKFSTFQTGAGIAFHPGARGTNTLPIEERLAFVASDDATIQILDVAHFLDAGTLPIKQKLYGPLRVTRRFTGLNPDPAEIVLKLYGVSLTGGLTVIDVRAGDLKPVP